MATKLGMKSGTHDSVTVPVGSVTVPSLLKLNFILEFE